MALACPHAFWYTRLRSPPTGMKEGTFYERWDFSRLDLYIYCSFTSICVAKALDVGHSACASYPFPHKSYTPIRKQNTGPLDAHTLTSAILLLPPQRPHCASHVCLHSSAQLQNLEDSACECRGDHQLRPAISLQRYHAPRGDDDSNHHLFTITHEQQLNARLFQIWKWGI